MPSTHVGAVTGANKGIGLAIIRNLALQYPSSFLKSQSAIPSSSLLIYLTARDKTRGEEAVRLIYDDAELRRRKVLRNHDGEGEGQGAVTVKFHQLDISDEGSIEGFEAFLRSEHPDGIDFLVNNAAIAMNGFDNTVVRQTLHSNYYGTLAMTLKFLPLIKNGGRLVNVSSTAGSLHKFSPSIQKSFRDAKTVAEVTSLMQKFAGDVEAGKEKERGWVSAAYATSKAGVTGMTRAVAYQERQKGSKTLINACCPGYVATDMTRGGGFKTPDQGAKTPVLLALGDIKEQSGLFWQSEKVLQW